MKWFLAALLALSICGPASAGSKIYDVGKRSAFGVMAEGVAWKRGGAYTAAFAPAVYISYTTTSQTSVFGSYAHGVSSNWSIAKVGANLAFAGYDSTSRVQFGVGVSAVHQTGLDSLYVKDSPWSYEVALKASLGLIQNAAKRNVAYLAPAVTFDSENNLLTYQLAINVPIKR